jgi:hypothetical protein
MHPRLPSATPSTLLLVLFVAIVLAACSNSSSVTGPKDGKVRPGIWGGDHVGVTVTETGSTLEYDCAAGTIDQPFVLDAAGRFDLVGTHVRGHGGPTRIDEQPDRHPARYTGTVDGGTMTLTVTMTDLNQTVGTFSLTVGASPRIVRCL